MPEDESVLTRNARVPDQVIAYGAQPGQIVEVRRGTAGAGQRPLVLIIHGGFWRSDIDRAHARPMADAIAAAGWTAALPEYSRVPLNPGPTLADLTLLLGEVAEHISDHNGEVLLLGHSAGGHLALWAAAARLCPTLIGTVALAPVADLLLAHELRLGSGAVARFLGADPVSRPDIDPRQMLPAATPTTLIHGEQDAIVPRLISDSYAAAHPGARLVPVAGAGHYALIDPLSAAWPIVMAQLSR